MLKTKLLITREIFPDIIERLSKYYDIEVWSKYSNPPRDILAEKAKDADALLTMLTNKVDGTLMQNAESLGIIA